MSMTTPSRGRSVPRRAAPVPRRRRRRGRLPVGRQRTRRAVRPRLAGQRRHVPHAAAPPGRPRHLPRHRPARRRIQSVHRSDTTLTVDQHIHTVRRVVDLLELDDVAVVGHDSGGMIARHALAGDPRLRAMGLINTEQPHGPELALQVVPCRPGTCRASVQASAGSRADRGCAATRSCSATPSPTRRCSTASSTSSSSGHCTHSPAHRAAAMRLLRSFDTQLRSRPGCDPPPDQRAGSAGLGRSRPVLPYRMGPRDGGHASPTPSSRSSRAPACSPTRNDQPKSLVRCCPFSSRPSAAWPRFQLQRVVSTPTARPRAQLRAGRRRPQQVV